MPANLNGILDYLRDDNALRNALPNGQYNSGLAAAGVLNGLLEDAIDRTGVNDDGLITADDVRRLANSIQNRAGDLADFRTAHGSESGGESGFHLLRGDGGTQLFRNTGFVDRVADAIYSIGFGTSGGRVLDENGNQTASLEEVAGWLNFFLNGKTGVFGTDAGETLYHSVYHADYFDAESEIFYAGGGADSVWGGAGRDHIYLGTGNDRADGGDGRDMIKGGAGEDTISGGSGGDKIYGGADSDLIGSGLGDDWLYGGGGADTLVAADGADTLYGGEGSDQLESWGHKDTLYGDAGSDRLYGGDANDKLFGGRGQDSLYGEGGSDRMYGGAGNDRLWGYEGQDRMFGGEGSDTFYAMDGNDVLFGGGGRDLLGGQEGNDKVYGGGGNDTLMGQAGQDTLMGGKGADQINIWEASQERDVLIFKPGHSGTALGDIDRVEGFRSGDKIDLSAFDNLQFRAGDFRGNGHVSAYFDGDYLRIDEDGDGDMDMRISFAGTASLGEDDLIL